jgi:hypothetical protein
MSITESATVKLTCDSKACSNSATVTRPTRELCNRMLYTLGWRLMGQGQFCSDCIAKRAR